jgi:hypothetical protein
MMIYSIYAGKFLINKKIRPRSFSLYNIYKIVGISRTRAGVLTAGRIIYIGDLLNPSVVQRPTISRKYEYVEMILYSINKSAYDCIRNAPSYYVVINQSKPNLTSVNSSYSGDLRPWPLPVSNSSL